MSFVACLELLATGDPARSYLDCPTLTVGLSCSRATYRLLRPLDEYWRNRVLAYTAARQRRQRLVDQLISLSFDINRWERELADYDGLRRVAAHPGNTPRRSGLTLEPISHNGVAS